MTKLFLDKEEVKDFKKIRDNKVRLLTHFFLGILKRNKFLFFICSFFSVFTSLINYNTNVMIRNAFLLPSNSFDEKVFDLLGKEEDSLRKEDLIKRLESLEKNLSIKNSSKLNSIIKNVKGLEIANLDKDKVFSIFKLHLIEDQRIYEKRMNFSFNFVVWSLSTNLIWKKFIFSFIGLLVFVKAPFSLLHWYANNYSCDKIEKDLKYELFKTLTNAKYERSSEISGKMLTQFTSDLDNIARNIWLVPNRLVYVIVSIYLNIWFDFRSNGKMSFGFITIITLIFTFLFVLVFVLLRKAIKLGIEAKRRYEEDNRIIFERIKNLEYIKSNSSEKFEQEKVSLRLDQTFVKNKRSLLWTALFKTLPNYLVIPNIPFIFMAVVTVLYKREEMRRNPQFIFANFILYYFTVRTINNEVNKILESILSIEDLSSELSIVTESSLNLSNERNESRLENKNFEPGNITFESVSFIYPSRPNNLVISNLSFVFENGKKYGIAGKNGIGKSTITKILLKLYKISSGRVLIGNTELSTIKSHTLHENICHLTNRPTFFNMSIAENVFYPFFYDEKKHLNDLIKASKKTKIWKFIKSLNSGFNTVLKENGSDLSEGQKQQLEATKVFLRKYNIYIFDEILSNVHPITRKTILKNIFDEVKNGIVITIDHHYDVFNHMDCVYAFSSKKFSKVREFKNLKGDENKNI